MKHIDDLKDCLMQQFGTGRNTCKVYCYSGIFADLSKSHILVKMDECSGRFPTLYGFELCIDCDLGVGEFYLSYSDTCY